MSAIRDYLEETLKSEGRGGWTKRSPRATHPEILQLVREFEAGGGGVNEQAEQFVEERAGDLPEHYYHGHDDRHELTYQLASEIFIARHIIRDEALAEEEQRLIASGYVRVVDEDEIVDGARYTVRVGAEYVGHEQIAWGRENLMRAARVNGRLGWIPKGARLPRVTIGPVLVREGWA